MTIDKIQVEEKEPGDAKQRVSARITIESDPTLRPEGSDLSVIVYFFDEVDGSRVEASTADTTQRFPTEPYDWTVDGREEIVVDYAQPVFTETQSRELGERVYYGYVIELYYQNILQDRVVMPPELESMGVAIPGAGSVMEENSGPLGPENALFPELP